MQDFFFTSIHLTFLTHFHYCPTQTCDFPASSPSLSTTPESLREGRSRREHTSLLFFPFYPFMSPRASISKGYWVLEIMGGKTEGQHLALSCVKVSPSLFSTHWSYVEILSAIKRVKTSAFSHYPSSQMALNSRCRWDDRFSGFFREEPFLLNEGV